MTGGYVISRFTIPNGDVFDLKTTGKHRAALIAAIIGAVSLTGCYKGNGTEIIPEKHKTAAVEENSHADADDAAFRDAEISESPDAKKEYPFDFDAAACEKPKQEIVMVMIYDNTEQRYKHSQTVNYFDRDGKCYRYRQALDLSGDWMNVLYDHYKAGAPAVSVMSEAETRTLWYLSAHAAEYQNAETVQQKPGKEILGVTWIYTVTERDEPVLLCREDDTCLYAGKPEIPAFLNWFRYYYHTFRYGT